MKCSSGNRQLTALPIEKILIIHAHRLKFQNYALALVADWQCTSDKFLMFGRNVQVIVQTVSHSTHLLIDF
jgi:hypothetical protein